jgi:hypothetical protein
VSNEDAVRFVESHDAGAVVRVSVRRIIHVMHEAVLAFPTTAQLEILKASSV